MEKHEIIARWLGWTQQDIKGVPHWVSPDGLNACPRHLPVRFDSDAAAVSLLPELVKRGYTVVLEDCQDGQGGEWRFSIYQRSPFKELVEIYQPTIAAAICAAITRMGEEER